MNRIIIIEIPHQLMGHWEEETLVCHYDDYENYGGDVDYTLHNIRPIVTVVIRTLYNIYSLRKV